MTLQLTLADKKPTALRHDFFHHASFKYGCQLFLESVLIEYQPLIIEAQQVKNRRVPIGDADLIVHRLIAELVGVSVNETLFQGCRGTSVSTNLIG